MIRISKLSDYALVLLTELQTDKVKSSKELSTSTKIPFATVNKVLKLMQKHKICDSKGGKTGGFFLLKEPSSISILSVINAIEGDDKHLTDCHHKEENSCQLKNNCKISKKMNSIDLEIHQVLSRKTLADLITNE